MRKYFGTDGIRGNVGTTAIRPDFLLNLGHSVGRILRARDQRAAVVIGKDTRVSGYMIESALQAGFTSAGVDVYLTGPLPTPAIAYLTRSMRLNLGVVISASHNPYHDNGIKFFSPTGEKLSDDWEREVEAMMDVPAEWVESRDLGKVSRLDYDGQGRYIEFAKSSFKGSLKGKKIIIDAAHGAAYKVAGKIFHELGADVHCIACEPDGFNINHEVGATSPEFLAKTVFLRGADYGIALDGDADRLVMCDNAGNVYDGDQLLYIIAVGRKARGESVPGVVGTVMSNMGVEAAFNRHGIEFVRARVGDRHILQELQSRGWTLGGESSGHVLTLDKHSTGDGIIAALQVFDALEGQTLIEGLSGIEVYHQHMKSVKLQANQVWDTPALKIAIERSEGQLGSTGRVLIRPSGTEPVLRVMVESRDDALASRVLQDLLAIL